ncbi:hypothetical protein D9757_007414 [Collybiopsis confluens]|uniref:Uncharacterized protein n=1 Tax=Collybiopsis confluens TaxID=2823264 RepID=A0A8H5M796_9AGAR|nr:hypothetical protein D9757_007414 [Collybiopsis confluens]
MRNENLVAALEVPVGLVNLGNTHHMTSNVHALRVIPELHPHLRLRQRSPLSREHSQFPLQISTHVYVVIVPAASIYQLAKRRTQEDGTRSSCYSPPQLSRKNTQSRILPFSSNYQRLLPYAKIAHSEVQVGAEAMTQAIKSLALADTASASVARGVLGLVTMIGIGMSRGPDRLVRSDAAGHEEDWGGGGRRLGPNAQVFRKLLASMRRVGKVGKVGGDRRVPGPERPARSGTASHGEMRRGRLGAAGPERLCSFEHCWPWDRRHS